MSARRPRADERGVALLLVLWVFMVLGVLALDFARYMRDDAMAAVNMADETRGYYVAIAAINRAIFELEQAREDFDEEDDLSLDGDEAGDEDESENADEDADVDDDAEDIDGLESGQFTGADGAWHEDVFGDVRYAVRVVDEGGLVSLRTADEALLTRIVTGLVRGGNATRGVDRRTAGAISTVVDSILDWTDPDDLARNQGAESAYYLGLANPHRAKNGWFDSPEELLLVRGVTPALFYGTDGMPGLRDVVSVYGRQETVNVRTAPAAVFQALLGVDALEASELIAAREEETPRAFFLRVQARLRAVDPALAETRLASGAPRMVRVEARADVAAPRNQAHVAAVMDLASELTEGVRVVRWLDRAPWEGGLPTARSRPEGTG